MSVTCQYIFELVRSNDHHRQTVETFIVSERSLLVINHGLRDRLPYRCGVVRHVRLSCSWGCSAVDVEHATSDHFLQPKGKLNAHHVVLFLFLPSLGVKSSTTMPFFHVFFVFGAPFATDYGACRTNSNALASATYSFVCSQQ